ncbi:MAG: GNAT family N-acetyltransferase [Gemmatimonadaceae bacterium]|nr:GNAT family N-acetyltransferase [Gemmatimonadaceae bacterium]
MSERRRIVSVSPSLLPEASLVLERALHDTPYLAAALDALRAAATAPEAEARALAHVSDDRVDGVIVFGIFGGTSGAGRLHLVAVDETARRARCGSALVREATAGLRTEGSRFVLAELPDDPRALPGARAFLEALGFREESRIEHFYRDGIALSFMRRELARE